MWLVQQEDHVANNGEDTQERLRQVEAECETAMDGPGIWNDETAGGKRRAKKRRELHGAITHQQQVFKLKAERDELAQKACKRVIALVISVKESLYLTTQSIRCA